MLVSKEQFDRDMSSGTGISIVLLGMSGAGKSYWGRQLSSHYSLPLTEIDEMIGKAPEFRKGPGRDKPQVYRLGEYFGMPWEEGFSEKEKAYLTVERRLMRSLDPNGSIIDLTGSCIYHPDEMRTLGKSGLMLYLEDGRDIETMVEEFLENPRPVCWNGSYVRAADEHPMAALRKCYPALAQERRGLYQDFSDVTIQVRRDLTDVEGFLEAIAKQL